MVSTTRCNNFLPDLCILYHWAWLEYQLFVICNENAFSKYFTLRQKTHGVVRESGSTGAMILLKDEAPMLMIMVGRFHNNIALWLRMYSTYLTQLNQINRWQYIIHSPSRLWHMASINVVPTRWWCCLQDVTEYILLWFFLWPGQLILYVRILICIWF